MMRLAVLADIHGNVDALDTVLADLESKGGADKLWVLGDLAAFCPDPAASVARVRALEGAEVIYGNTDRYLTTGRRPKTAPSDAQAWQQMQATLAARDGGFAWTVGQLSYDAYDYLNKLPPELSMRVPGYGRVVAFHAAPGDDEHNLLPETPEDEVADALLDRQGRLALHGHTHLPTDRTAGTWRVLNPGSVGLPFDGDQRAAYALVSWDEAGTMQVSIERVAYDVQAVIDKLRQAGAPNAAWVIRILETARPPGWRG